MPGGDCRVVNLPQFAAGDKTALCRANSLSVHEGTDVLVSKGMAARGVDVLAAADGTVLWVFDGKYDRCPDAKHPDCRNPAAPKPGSREGTTVCTPLGPFCKDGAGQCYWCFAGGNVVVLRHRLPGVFATRYDHFKTGSIKVRPGQAVKKGAVLGQVGSAGHSSGPHLHFEVWGSTYYDPVDPWVGRCSPPGRKGLWADQPFVR
jgi:murein DD-endopeptidase MepM/ murein hydrolase activator NlpD